MKDRACIDPARPVANPACVAVVRVGVRCLSVTRSAFRLVLVCALLVSTQGMLLVNLAFKANARFIAETLCVNRARPELNCHGRCQLAKMRKAQEEREAKHVAGVEAVVGAFAATETTRPVVASGVTAPAVRAALPRPGDWMAGPEGRADGVFQPPRGV